MDTRSRTSRLAVAVVACAVYPWATEAQTPTPAPVVLQVHGTAALPDSIVVRAQEVVTRIYSAAETPVAWRHVSTGAPAAPAGFEIAVLIRFRIHEAPRAVLGFASDSPDSRGRLVYVFYDHVEDFAITNRLDIGHALGHVIAHEVGHLLLPSNAHSKAGIMRGHLTYQDLRLAARGVIPFTPGQAAQIRARLTGSDGSRRVSETVQSPRKVG